MSSKMKKIMCMVAVFSLAAGTLMTATGHSAELKIGYVDLRRAFYEYDKTKNLETELTAMTEDSQDKRTKMIEEITTLRDETALLSDEAKKKKQRLIDQKLAELQEFDAGTRQVLLNKKNDMFREVIEDVQEVVIEMGKAGGYDYVLDSRNIMYSNENLDMTDEVLKRLNK